VKILLVEDDPLRIEWFRARFGEALAVTRHVEEAWRWLTSEFDYDMLFLDHDLGTEPRVGRDVAIWLAQYPEVQPGMTIIVHSMNIVSAPKILRDLAEGGRSAMVSWMPFSSLVASDTWGLATPYPDVMIMPKAPLA
jgi:CheY-like chemotaxis protein